MEIEPKFLFGKVMHKRLSPKVNEFSYEIFYISFPLSGIGKLRDGFRFGLDRFGLLSFYQKDHGDLSGRDLLPWIKNILKEQEISEADGEIVLVTMPRVIGYVFNPITFWLCHDRKKQLRAVLCEVNNTFGEKHCYLCVHDDKSVIGDNDQFIARKLFHVSPFLTREGHYNFRFAVHEQNFGVWIDYLEGEGRKQLLTALTGRLEPWSRMNNRKAFWGYPLVTLKAIGLIHFQAVKLLFKGVKYVPKPHQFDEKLSKTDRNTKN